MPILAGADGGIVYRGNWNLIVQAETQKEPESKKHSNGEKSVEENARQNNTKQDLNGSMHEEKKERTVTKTILRGLKTQNKNNS